MNRISGFFFLLLLLSTNCCTPIIIGTAATAVVATSMQEKTVGNVIDDKTLWLKIKNALIKKNLFRGISISIDEGRVLLTGNVKTSMNRILIARTVWDQLGVRELMNEIEVNERESSFTKSAWITTQIKTKLLVKGSVRSLNYTVETYNGVVYLLGIARSKNELNEVMSIARKIDGVDQVISYVRLRDSSLRFK